MEYRVNLPSTSFPMKANLPQREPAAVARWQEMGLYEKMRAQAAGRKRFILHDGPPYANGEIHLGTALNKVLKDFVVKFKHLDGFDAPYVPGWDCHGLPIELKTMEHNKGLADPAVIRERCREYAMRFVVKQREDFIRLGVLGTWFDPYLTLNPVYESRQLEMFATLVERNLVYRALKPIYWCPHCETALAEAEIEYQDHRSASIFVRFEVRPETMGAELAAAVAGRRLFMAIWTTTPWTLPGNVAIALHPTHAYGVYEAGADLLIVARELAPRVADRTHLELKGPLATFPGAAFSGLLARHPFLDRDSRVVTNEKHVTLDEGTGAVHIAPGHGQEDHEIGLEHKLPILSPVDGKGRMTAESGPFGGLFYEKANARICDHLRQKEALLGEEEVDHSYPHCWRCKNPVIFRASLQWFVSVDRRDVRKRALEAIEQVRWVPTVGIKRIGGMLETRPDWCISRQRVWGVPIPAFYCQDCERETLDAAVIRHVASKVATEGSTLWWSREARDLLPPAAACRHCGSQRLRKETDIMDVWFDSGVSHASVLTTRPDQSWPADLYLEGSDQHRGWFQTSLLTSVAALDAAPYRQVLTHGFVVDEAGRKMSKSLGNVIVPQELTRELGADILRLWVASSDYTTDIKASKKILQQCTDMYRRVRNTLRFMLGNTSDFDPTRHAVGVDQMEELDRWALALLADAVEKAHEHYEHYRFYLVLHLLHNLCAVELSSFYLDILKDRLYCSAPGSRERRSAQTALYHWLRALIQMLAPIMSFTAEESFALVNWQGEKPASVFLTSWPRVEEDWKDPMLLARWEHLMAFKKGASKALELAREKKVIGSSLEALLSVYVPDQALAHDVEHNLRQFEEVCIVSRLRLVASAVEVSRDERLEEPESSEFVPGVVFGVTRAGGNKCQRCWKYDQKVGADGDHPGLCPRCLTVVKQA